MICSQLRALVEERGADVVDHADSKGTVRKNFPGDGREVAEIYQEAELVVGGEVELHQEVGPDDRRRDIRDSDFPFKLAGAEADAHLASAEASDGRAVGRLKGV